MVTRDFHVDAGGLSQLVEKISAVEQMVWDHDVEDFLPSGEVRHAGVAEGVQEFSERWELGINAMAEDLAQIAGRLSGALEAYGEYNQLAEEAMNELQGIMASLSPAPTSLTAPGQVPTSRTPMQG